jgi:hypothetical protein
MRRRLMQSSDAKHVPQPGLRMVVDAARNNNAWLIYRACKLLQPARAGKGGGGGVRMYTRMYLSLCLLQDAKNTKIPLSMPLMARKIYTQHRYMSC